MYVIDSDVLITAKNSYYAFDLCPGFWSSLRVKHRAGQVHSLRGGGYDADVAAC